MKFTRVALIVLLGILAVNCGGPLAHSSNLRVNDDSVGSQGWIIGWKAESARDSPFTVTKETTEASAKYSNNIINGRMQQL